MTEFVTPLVPVWNCSKQHPVGVFVHKDMFYFNHKEGNTGDPRLGLSTGDVSGGFDFMGVVMFLAEQAKDNKMNYVLNDNGTVTFDKDGADTFTMETGIVAEVAGDGTTVELKRNGNSVAIIPVVLPCVLPAELEGATPYVDVNNGYNLDEQVRVDAGSYGLPDGSTIEVLEDTFYKSLVVNNHVHPLSASATGNWADPVPLKEACGMPCCRTVTTP